MIRTAFREDQRKFAAHLRHIRNESDLEDLEELRHAMERRSKRAIVRDRPGMRGRHWKSCRRDQREPNPMTTWIRVATFTAGAYEAEVTRRGYTGWTRCVGGCLADGRWPQFHESGATRYIQT